MTFFGIFFRLIALGLLSHVASSAVIKVPPGSFTITKAMANASDGDTLLLGTGVFEEGTSLKIPRNKALKLIGEGADRSQILVTPFSDQDSQAPLLAIMGLNSSMISLSVGTSMVQCSIKNNTDFNTLTPNTTRAYTDPLIGGDSTTTTYVFFGRRDSFPPVASIAQQRCTSVGAGAVLKDITYEIRAGCLYYLRYTIADSAAAACYNSTKLNRDANLTTSTVQLQPLNKSPLVIVPSTLRFTNHNLLQLKASGNILDFQGNVFGPAVITSVLALPEGGDTSTIKSTIVFYVPYPYMIRNQSNGTVALAQRTNAPRGQWSLATSGCVAPNPTGPGTADLTAMNVCEQVVTFNVDGLCDVNTYYVIQDLPIVCRPEARGCNVTDFGGPKVVKGNNTAPYAPTVGRFGFSAPSVCETSNTVAKGRFSSDAVIYRNTERTQVQNMTLFLLGSTVPFSVRVNVTDPATTQMLDGRLLTILRSTDTSCGDYDDDFATDSAAYTGTFRLASNTQAFLDLDLNVNLAMVCPESGNKASSLTVTVNVGIDYIPLDLVGSRRRRRQIQTRHRLSARITPADGTSSQPFMGTKIVAEKTMGVVYNNDTFIEWTQPPPAKIIAPSDKSSNVKWIAIGSAVGAAALLACITTIVVFYRRVKQQGKDRATTNPVLTRTNSSLMNEPMQLSRVALRRQSLDSTSGLGNHSLTSITDMRMLSLIALPGEPGKLSRTASMRSNGSAETLTTLSRTPRDSVGHHHHEVGMTRSGSMLVPLESGRLQRTSSLRSVDGGRSLRRTASLTHDPLPTEIVMASNSEVDIANFCMDPADKIKRLRKIEQLAVQVDAPLKEVSSDDLREAMKRAQSGPLDAAIPAGLSVPGTTCTRSISSKRSRSASVLSNASPAMVESDIPVYITMSTPQSHTPGQNSPALSDCESDSHTDSQGHRSRQPSTRKRAHTSNLARVKGELRLEDRAGSTRSHSSTRSNGSEQGMLRTTSSGSHMHGLVEGTLKRLSSLRRSATTTTTTTTTTTSTTTSSPTKTHVPAKNTPSQSPTAAASHVSAHPASSPTMETSPAIPTMGVGAKTSEQQAAVDMEVEPEPMGPSVGGS